MENPSADTKQKAKGVSPIQTGSCNVPKDLTPTVILNDKGEQAGLAYLSPSMLGAGQPVSQPEQRRSSAPVISGWGNGTCKNAANNWGRGFEAGQN